MRLKIIVWCGVLAWWAGLGGSAARAYSTTSLTFSQTNGIYNLQATNFNFGGQAYTNSFPTYGSTNQFASVLAFGAVVYPTNSAHLASGRVTPSTNYPAAAAAGALSLPVGVTNGVVGLILQYAQSGASYYQSSVTYNFGGIISPPLTDLNGLTLTNNAATYWLAETYTTNAHAGDPFYYSPNAGVVFATQPGQVQITWVAAAGYATTNSVPPSYTNVLGALTGVPNSVLINSATHLLFTTTYLVSGQPVKPAQNFYWTEGSFSALSYSLTLPPGRVTDIHVAFNSSFPAAVTNPYQDPNSPGTTNLETRTLWLDQTGPQYRLHALNAQGLVFVELLGNPLVGGGGGSQYLGFELVNVLEAPTAAFATVNLGNPLSPFSDGFEGQSLTCSPIANTGGTTFYYEQYGAGTNTFYADHLTTHLTDLQAYWLTTGVAGLQWPNLFVDYTLVWPSDPAQYSDYLRPLVATPALASQTAVPLDPAEVPALDYYDPLDQVRAFLTSSNTFYTWLSQAYPANRALLRFNVGNNVRFERVFSFLGQALQTNALFAGSVATSLTAWNPTNSTLTNFASGYNPPYVTNLTAYVGQALNDPPGEIGSTNGTYGDYWAGFINTNQNASAGIAGLNPNLGTSYDPYAYVNPFQGGFVAANQGAIIPVNAIPGQNLLEVWWFRQNTADTTLGFQPVYWPAIIADYTLVWPGSNTNQIVLASNAGSGPLDNEQAAGSIYYQNDPAQPGYNPNEEHALMLGGQAYALRDDLNVTNGGGYSSAPYVLLAYDGDDGRPAMAVFPVLRENPAAGIFFDYIVAAGSQLQAPMPLPLMALPLAPNSSLPGGITNYDNPPPATSADLPAGWSSAAASGAYGRYQGFTFQDRNNNFWVYRGLNAGLPALQAGFYDTNTSAFVASLPAATAILNQPFATYVHVSRQVASLTAGAASLPGGFNQPVVTTNGILLSGTPVSAGSNTVAITVQDNDGSTATASLPLTVVTNGVPVALGPLVIISTNQFTGSTNIYTGRPPSLAQAPASSNCFTMRFYYKTQTGFAWPSLGNATNWPAVDTIVPYLRPYLNGSFSGTGTNTDSPPLDIVYRPVWPSFAADGVSPLPLLDQGQTLTTAINNLAAVRGQDSVQVIYQQSIATNSITASPVNSSVVLFDPTTRKKSSLAGITSSATVPNLPASVQADSYNGLDYFPTLPPNLVSRVWFDPNTTNLVLTGQFVTDAVAGNYVMLNVLSPDDLGAVDGLCNRQDPQYSAWTAAVAGLSAVVHTYWDDPNNYYIYGVNAALDVTDSAANLLEITNSDTAVDSYALSAVGPGNGYITYVVANGLNPKYSGDPVSVYVARVGQPLFPGALVQVNPANASPFSQTITFQHTADLAARTANYAYDWRIAPPVNGAPPAGETNWTKLTQTNSGPVFTLGASGIQGLSDNYVALRYGYTNSLHNLVWSPWSDQFAPGWIKRVSQNLDPIAGQTQNLFNNPATTTASLIALAGARWTGNVPLNAAALTNNGLIQIYESVLNVGKSLSINSGINYGPANQALLLAAGYLNDFYSTLGNDAWANSLNPTIEIGTDNQTYGNIATSQFVFEGEEPTLLEQNLALLRGRDDSLSPGVDVPPVYNHLFWNYTYGLAAGQVMYALNYNITDQNGDGVVNAADAEIMYPQGHGDAYGHYLTAIMNYWELLMNPNFDWVPQSEAVSILGATVQVNYQDETKFATTAAALARTGRQVFDLTWRQDYVPGTAGGWNYFASNHVGQYTYVDNHGNVQNITRYWGLDHWASRVGRGAYLNWVAGNAILPPKDTNPNDQGVAIVDRTTVPELQELPATLQALQNDVDNANAGFTPLGLAQNAIPFDINPQQVTGASPQTHFEQIYARAVQALNNAVVAFNAAQNVTSDLRQQQNSLSDLQAAVTQQELAYNDQLIELYGTPFPDDIGPGATWPQGYTGPDLIHYMYVDFPATNTYGGILPDPAVSSTFQVDVQNFPSSWWSSTFDNFDFITQSVSPNYNTNDYLTFNIGPDGFGKPAAWTSERASVGGIQTAAAAANAASDQLRAACSQAVGDKQSLDKAMQLFAAGNTINLASLALQSYITNEQTEINGLQNELAIENLAFGSALYDAANTISAAGASVEGLYIAIGTAVGAGATSAAQVITEIPQNIDIKNDLNRISSYTELLAVNQNDQNLLTGVANLGQLEGTVQNDLAVINTAQNAVNGAQANYLTLVTQGNRLQQERLTFRKHTAAQVQGYTVANSAFLVFQNEDLERYNTLFNLAQEYAWMAAQAYDYETGLLGTPAGQAYLNQIISSCALGVIQNGQPQISGTTTGDPGLANALAEMAGDFEVLKGRLGFNNPDGYGTTVSLREENYRINSGSTGDNNWQQVLQQGLLPDLLADTDVKRNCLQIDDGSGAAVPGIELTFSTTITDGQNLFGQANGPGDHSFSPASFATKIFAAGVDFDGYVGMDNPVSNSGAGGTSPSDPTLDPNGLSATPYIYLIPCGADSMRSPPLGDTSTIRTWNVDDVAIPLPFNIGASDFSDAPFYQAADSLTEPLFAVRKQQPFRPVSTLQAFNTSIYGANGSLAPSQYTNQRLIGRSIWNSKWKLIIPGKTLLADPNQGLARFINTVKDIHLYFVTYSYAGN